MDVDAQVESIYAKKRYRAPRTAVELTSTRDHNVDSGQQKAATSNLSTPKSRMGTPDPSVLHLNYIVAKPH